MTVRSNLIDHLSLIVRTKLYFEPRIYNRSRIKSHTQTNKCHIKVTFAGSVADTAWRSTNVAVLKIVTFW